MTDIDRISRLLNSHYSEAREKCGAPNVAFGAIFGGRAITGHDDELPFRIASMSKSFIAAAVVLLRDRGMLQLDQPIADIVPELDGLQLPTSDSPEVTVRHLLTMSSGLATDDPWGDRQIDASKKQMDEWMRGGGYFATAPETSFVYSNYGYAVLGRVITNIAKTPFQLFVENELLKPLAMRATTWSVPEGNYAQPFRRQDGKSIPEGQPPLADGEFSAMGGIWTTVKDLLIWCAFLLDAFPARDGNDDAVLCCASRREMQQSWRMSGFESVEILGERKTFCSGYGYGLKVFEHENHGGFVGHTGGLPGYGSHMLWYPERSFALVSFANVTYARMPMANYEAVELLSSNELLPEKRKLFSDVVSSHAQSLIELFNDWSDEQASAIFADNVVLDESFERRRMEIREIVGAQTKLEIKEVHTKNAASGMIAAVNALDGRTYTVTFDLSPQIPPRIQRYAISDDG